MATAIIANNAVTKKLESNAWKKSNAYRIHLLITVEEGEGFSAIALNLPGAGSCGDTEKEAVENAKEAVSGVLEAYQESGDAIPWKDTSGVEIPAEAKQRWIILDG